MTTSPNSTNISPPNSLVFLSDADGGEAPFPVWGAIILSTPSCVSIACYPEQDGPTEIVLGGAAKVAPDDQPAFVLLSHPRWPERVVIGWS
jgi:hypothetical protein